MGNVVSRNIRHAITSIKVIPWFLALALLRLLLLRCCIARLFLASTRIRHMSTALAGSINTAGSRQLSNRSPQTLDSLSQLPWSPAKSQLVSSKVLLSAATCMVRTRRVPARWNQAFTVASSTTLTHHDIHNLLLLHSREASMGLVTQMSRSAVSRTRVQADTWTLR